MAALKKHKRTVEDASLIMCIVALMMFVITLFVSRWRVDLWGTGNVKEAYRFGKFSGWDSREYGLLHIKGTFRQSWSTLTTQACSARDLGSAAALFQGFTGWLTGGSDEDKVEQAKGTCKEDSQCSKGFQGHMAVRCLQYQEISKFSTATLGTSVMCMLFAVVGVIIGFMSKRTKYGGLTCGLLTFSGFMATVMNLVWAAMTDRAFKTIMESAWFPYPQLGICWFLHLYASLTLTLCGILYGLCVIPGVLKYDPDAKRINRHKKRLNFLREQRIRQDVNNERAQAVDVQPQQQGAWGGNPWFGMRQQQQAPPQMQGPLQPMGVLVAGPQAQGAQPQAQPYGLSGVVIFADGIVPPDDGVHYKQPNLPGPGAPATPAFDEGHGNFKASVAPAAHFGGDPGGTGNGVPAF